MRYFKADYMGETDPTYKKLLAKEGITTAEEENEGMSTEIQQKLIEEFSKIHSLDTAIVKTNKVYKAMKVNANMREESNKERMRREKEKKKLDLEKKK